MKYSGSKLISATEYQTHENFSKQHTQQSITMNSEISPWKPKWENQLQMGAESISAISGYNTFLALRRSSFPWTKAH
jgi:hypothetical protein